MYGLKQDWALEPRPRLFVLDDYESNVPRWCPGCGDTAVLTALQRVARDEQIPPEKLVAVSGIGCSSRLPHYMKTYGFHGIHGRAFPVACGVRARRPDLHIFVVTGDGDCCAIGTAHWIHATRYNMNMTVMLFDNNTYGLTKMQTSPTTEVGHFSNTHPRGALLNPIAPLSVMLGVPNVSFVAQTVDWNPAHVLSTIKAAHHHQGFSFIRILQRCPHYMSDVFDPIQRDPSRLLLLQHENGISVPDAIANTYPNKREHDPTDLAAARAIAGGGQADAFPIGLLYQNKDAQRYDLMTSEGLAMSAKDRVAAAQTAIDRFLV